MVPSLGPVGPARGPRPRREYARRRWHRPCPPPRRSSPSCSPTSSAARGEADELVLCEARVEDCEAPVTARRVRVDEAALRGVTIQDGTLTELVLRDARLTGCDLSNVSVRHGEVRRAELTNCRLVGFALGDGTLEDVRVSGGTLMLASLAQTTLPRSPASRRCAA